MRVVVIGSSGSSKSTFGHRLSGACDLARVELDALNWAPGLVDRSKTDLQDFVRRVDAAIAGDRWVTDWLPARFRAEPGCVAQVTPAENWKHPDARNGPEGLTCRPPA